MTGIELIAAERRRQIEREGWMPDHDDLHDREELALAAACYALPPRSRRREHDGNGTPVQWPWDGESWKPSADRVGDLVKAGALIAAELDRRSRAGNSQGKETACSERPSDWRESDVVKQARTMLTQIGTPLWPGLTESDWAEVLRGVLAERDFIGDWLQRLLDAEYERSRAANSHSDV